MRIARSVSPRRRNRLPRAKCSSTVSGSTLTTSMNASIALSGCSLSRKLRPLKYERGRCRDSDRSCLMSTRAASQPRPKKRANPNSHQSSKSMARSGRRRHGAIASRAQRALEPVDFAALREQARQAAEHAERGAESEKQEQHEDHRDLPRPPEEEVQLHRIRIHEREREYQDEQERPQQPRQTIDDFHALKVKRRHLVDAAAPNMPPAQCPISGRPSRALPCPP